MFLVALSIIAKTWKQQRCPSIDEWINCGTPRQEKINSIHYILCDSYIYTDTHNAFLHTHTHTVKLSNVK